MRIKVNILIGFIVMLLLAFGMVGVTLAAPAVGVTLGGAGDVFIGASPLAMSVTFDNTAPTGAGNIGYGPFVDVYFPVNGADGAAGTSLPLDGLDYLAGSATYLGLAVTEVVLTFPAAPLGAPCAAGQSFVDHPYAVDSFHDPIQVCGTPGDKLVVFQLPFGSFTPDQPPATIEFEASLSNFADLNVPLQVYARGGYEYGADPLDNPCCDPSIFTDGTPLTITDNPVGAVNPILLTLTKSNTPPEGEVATGPNFPHTYTVTVEAAPGQTITNLDIFDYVDDNIVITGISAVGASSVTLGGLPVAFPVGPVLANGTANRLVVTYASFSGTVSFDISYFVPLLDASGANIITPSNGAASLTNNTANTVGDWDPLDPRDAAGTNNASAGDGTCPACPPLVSHENEPMPIQKSVENLTDGTALDPDGTPSPGDDLQYTYTVQVSDFFAFDNADFFDVISDGQRLTGNPILTYTQHGTTYGPIAVTNFQELEYFTGGVPGVGGLPDADVTGEAAGDTVLKIDLSAELALLGLNEILGGCVPVGGTGAGNPNCATFNAGATTITVTYQTTIQDSFSDEFPSGDASVDHGDTLDNVVSLEIDTVLNTTNLAPSGVGSTVVDDSGAGVTIAQGLTEKTIYAITEVNTNTTTLNPAGVPEISPADVVTFRLRYEMPSTDFEDFSLSDFLPLPVLDANEVTVFNDVISNGTNTIGVGVPAAGQAMWGPTGVTDGNVNFRNRLTALGLNLQNGSPVPAITNPGSSIPALCGGTAISGAENFLNFCFGDFDDPLNVDSYIDILFSVTVSSDPYADGLFLTNFVRGGTGSTNAADANSDEIVMFELREPILMIRKGISDSTNPNETFTEIPNPALDSAGDATLPPFTGSLESGSAGGNGEADNGTDANAGGLDAGDTVRYVITIQNTGGSAAFDIRLFDSLPVGLTCNAGTVNLNVTMGDGTPVAYTNLGTASPCDFFTNFDGNALDGIELVDPADGLCQEATVDPARAVIVITYDLTIDNSVSAGDLLVNTTTITNFAGTEGGQTHLPDPLDYPFDEAEIEIAGSIEKDIISTSETSSSDAEVGIVGNERPVLVGEVVTYRIYTRIPEGTTNNLQFRDNTPNGLQYVTGSARFAFVSNTNGNIISSDGTINAALPWIAGNAPTTPSAIVPAGAISGGASSGDDLLVSFGNVTNNENDNGAEYIVLEFQMVVNNIAANQAGTFLLNTATLRKNGADLVTSDENTADVDNDPVALVVIEPIINITKTAIAAASRDAGDTVTYTVTIQNTGLARAFDMNMTDTLSADLNLVSVSTPASPAYYSEASRTVTTGAGGNFNITFTELRPGDTVTYTVTATIMNTALAGEPINNTAAVIWTSLPGTQGTANATPGASGADNGERNGNDGIGGAVDDYADNDQELITLNAHNATKSITASSETFTVDGALPNSGASRVPVAIGEVLRYQLVVDVPEGTSTDLLVNDQLATGLGLIEDATIEISTLNFGVGNFDSIDFGASLEAANGATVDLHNGTTYVFTAPFNLVTYTAGNLLTFNLGDIVNNDSDANIEQIIITFNVVVRNTNATNFSNIIANSFTVLTDDAVGTSELRDTSNVVELRVQEPLITIAKSLSPLTGDAGDTFTYSLVVSNTAGINRTTAFEVQVTDNLGALTDLDLTAVSAVGATDNSNLATDFVDVTIPSIPAGGSFTITLTVVLRSSATPNEIITNTATAIWTSLPATGTVGNPTGSNTPGGSGADNGERDSSTAPASPDDYRTSDTADLTVDQVVPVKSIIASSESSTSDASFPNIGGSNVPVAIGEIVTLQLVVSIPEGTSSDVIMSDILVPGLDYVSGSARVYTNSASLMNFLDMGAVPNSSPGAVIATDGDAALPAAAGTVFFDAGTREVQINIGDILNNDSDADAEQVIVTFQVVVLNSAANNLGTIWSNTFNVRVAGNAPVTSNAVTGIIQEPVLTIDKSINTTLSNPSGVTVFDGGDTVVYDIVVTGGNLANQSTAFDLNVLDGIDVNLDLVSVAFIGTPAYATTVDNSDYAMPIQAVDVTISELRPGDFITVRVTATVRSSVTIGQIIANTATTTWTSLPGNQGTANATPGNSGDSNGERNGNTISENDYVATDVINFTVTGTVDTIKSIDGTSEAHTDDTTTDVSGDERPVAVGEVITYRLVVEIPEGTSPDVQVTDTFATNIEYIAGSARVSFSANNAVTGTGSYGINEINPSTIFPAGQISFGAINPRELRFDVGQVINNDNDNAVTTELLIIEFQVVVVNTSDNTIGDIWSNDFEVDLNNDATDEDVSNEVFNIVQEPVLTIDKSINTTLSNPSGVTVFDGGDTVVYDIVVTGGNLANQSTAFDLNVLDGIDVNLDLVSVAFIGTPAYATTTDNSDYAMPIQAVDVVISELRPGDFITVRVTATVRSTVTIAQVIANTAEVSWTSLPGNQGTGNATPGNSGDSNGERNGNTISENDYVTDDTVNFSVTGTVDTIKSIDGTSEAHTDDTTTDVSGDERPVVIGEVITYRLVVEVPEGTSPDVQVTDTFATNIEYIAGSARVSFSANTAFTGTGSYGINEPNPSTIFPAGQTSFGVTGPRELRFDVGEVINNDNDDAVTTELLIIEFQVVVVNTSDNTLGDIWANDFEVDLNNDGTDEDASNQVFNIVQEPVVTASKAIIGAAPVDALENVTYDIVITAGNAANQETAYNLNVLDVLHPDLQLVSVTIQTNPGYVTIDATIPGNDVNIFLNRLEPGDSVTIRVVAEVQTTVSPGETIDNDAVITWTSLPGPQGTGNTTPGNSGDSNGERNGTTTGENDHNTPTNTVNFTILSPEPVKSIDGTSEIGTSDAEDGSLGNERPVAIGEEVTYRLAVTLPESTSISFRLDDVLANGIEYVAGSARVSYLADTAPLFNAVFDDNNAPDIANETEPSFVFPASNVSFNGGTRTLSFDFGGIINNDGDAGYEYIIVEFTVVVVDDTAINNTGQIWANDFDVVIDESLPTETITTSNSVGIIVVEPDVTITKTFTPDEVVRGTTITMTLVVSNLAADGATGPAYDLQVTDILDDWLNVESNANIAVSFNGAATSFGSSSDISNSVVTAGFATGVTDNIDVRISGLPVDGLATITVTMQVEPNADPLLLSRTITNTATVVNDTLSTDVTPDDEDHEYTVSASADLYVVKPTLLVTKTDSIDPVAAGALMSYTVTIQNTGTPNFAATNVEFSDEIPAGFIVTLVQPSQGTCSPIIGGILPCSLGTIASGASANVLITGRYPSTTASGTITNNIAYVSSTEGNNGNDGNDTPTDNDDERAEEPTTILRQVDVSIVKIVDDASPNEGDLITFTLNVTNNGSSQATNVVVTDSIPAGLTFVQFVPGTLPCVYAAPTLTCTFPTLSVGQTRTIGIEATVDAGTAGTAAITNIASVTSTEPESNPANNTDDAVVTVDSMDLLVVKVVDDATPSEGDTIVYTITVTNLGPAPATGVTITDDLNAVTGITYVSDDSASTTTTYSSVTGLWTLTGITLDAGDSLSLNIIATVNVGASALPQPLVNNAVLSASNQPDTNPANNTDNANVSVGGLDLSLIKGVNNPTPNEGDTIVYSIIVQNLGAANATNIVVLDQLDTIPVSYVSHVANRPGTTYNQVTGQWTIPGLLAGRSIRLDITVTVNAGTAGSTITNVASINSVDQNDANPANNTDDAVITVGSLDLAVTKTVDNATPAEGDTIVYSVTIANNGPADATGVILADTLPVGVTYVSDNAATVLDSTGAATFYGAGTWLVGNLDSGDSLTLLITATVDAGTSSTTIDNIATLSAVNQPDTNPANNTDNAVIAVAGLDLQVTKTVDNITANEGDTLVYSITVENFGAANATNVEVTDDLNILPLAYVSDNAATVLDSLGAATAYNSGTGAWTIGQLNAGQSLTLQITVTVNAGTSGTTISNDAILTGVDQADSNPTNNDDDAIVTVGGVDVAVLKVVDNPAPLQGDNVTYTITVTNNGPGDATGVVISEDLPLDGVNLTYVSHNASQGTFTPGTPSSWNIGNLANGQSETLQLTVTVEIDNGQILNVASLSSVDQIDSNPANNSDDATITLNGIDLEVVKTVDNATPATGDTITYSIVATNNGPTTATGVNVLDILPAGISYLSDNSALLLDDLGAGTSFNPATGDWAIGQLNAGSTRTLTIQATVLINGGSVTNTAEITGNEPESDISNNIDDAVISVDSADLSLTKTISTTSPQIGDFISYTVTVSNAGPNIAYNVAVTDTLPSTVLYSGVFTASQGTFNGTVWTVGTIPVNGAATLQITVQVISNVGTFVNVAEVTASDQVDPDSTPNNGDPSEDDYDESSFVFDPPFGRKVFDASGLPELEWTVIWVNPNNDPLAISVTDPLPAGTSFVAGSLTCTSPGTLVVNTCAYDPINDEIVFTGTLFPDPGATPATINSANNRLIINYRMRVADGTTQVRNEALLDSVNGDNVVVSETWVRGSTSSPSIGAAIVLTKYAEPAIAFPGETLTWILEVSNPSGMAATGVIVTDSIPLGLSIQTTQADAGTATVSGQDVVWNIGTVAAGQTIRLRIVTQVSPSLNAPVTNTAYVTGDNVAGMQASATAAYVAGLPNTGETAWWTWLLWTSLLLVPLSLAGLWWLRRRMA